MKENQFYKVSEAAEILKVSRQTIYDWIKSGKLLTIEIAGYILIPSSSVEAAKNGTKKK